MPYAYMYHRPNREQADTWQMVYSLWKLHTCITDQTGNKLTLDKWFTVCGSFIHVPQTKQGTSWHLTNGLQSVEASYMYHRPNREQADTWQMVYSLWTLHTCTTDQTGNKLTLDKWLTVCGSFIPAAESGLSIGLSLSPCPSSVLDITVWALEQCLSSCPSSVLDTILWVFEWPPPAELFCPSTAQDKVYGNLNVMSYITYNASCLRHPRHFNLQLK